jgi:hypothetical protein
MEKFINNDRVRGGHSWQSQKTESKAKTEAKSKGKKQRLKIKAKTKAKDKRQRQKTNAKAKAADKGVRPTRSRLPQAVQHLRRRRQDFMIRTSESRAAVPAPTV